MSSLTMAACSPGNVSALQTHLAAIEDVGKNLENTGLVPLPPAIRSALPRLDRLGPKLAAIQLAADIQQGAAFQVHLEDLADP